VYQQGEDTGRFLEADLREYESLATTASPQLPRFLMRDGGEPVISSVAVWRALGTDHSPQSRCIFSAKQLAYAKQYLKKAGLRDQEVRLILLEATQRLNVELSALPEPDHDNTKKRKRPVVNADWYWYGQL
jgi:hypothetical protein